MNSLDKMRRAGLVNRVRRDLANWEFHLAGMHDQKSHGSWATGLGDSGGTVDASDRFGGVFDPHNIMTDKVQSAGGRALSRIDQVHGIEEGWPETITMIDNGEWLGEDDGSLGAYMPPEPDAPEGGIERGRMVIRATDDESQMSATIVHEFGHHVSLGQGVDKFRAEMMKEDSPLNKVFQAISGTDTLADLQDINKNAMAAAEKGSAGAKDIVGFTDYLLMPEELFARAYAQWVAVKTGDQVMLSDFNRVLSDDNMFIMQWTPREFEPVMSAMDDYFRSRGLLKE